MLALGLLTIGQAPRPDGLAREIREVLGSEFRVIERGALDGVSRADVAALLPGDDDYALVTLLADGTPVTIAKERILEHLQTQLDRLEVEDGVGATLLMCTGAFPPFRHRRPLVQPQAALYGVVIGLAAGSRIGSLAPLERQSEQAQAKWAGMGVTDVVLEAADPYGPDPHGAVRLAARRIGDAGASVLFMDCFGYDLAMRASARAVFGGPVVLARSLAARLVAEVSS